ncbi:solute carrier family 25 member 45 [Ophiostoma piceae UAMH 11346]|uniref:Solute carrier family 25 member 45 n=1 Tax=Ophiostoma piceae (strain UAMH 11346) TaxID=1262450 RepID=S3CF49_OPHP1|nr:solute carrier family 25 member 45 [Ophiostoma piceae UAMH 11346]
MSADFWAGYISGAASILVGNPLDLVKVRLQAGGPLSKPTDAPSASAGSRGTQTVAQALFRRTAALAAGSAAPVLGYGALNALLFVSYRQAELFLTPPGLDGDGSSRPASPTAATTWVAGAVAGMATWIVSAPTELVKCRAQLAAQAVPRAGAAPAPAPSSFQIAKEVWRAEGVRGFFLGGTVTALRDSIGYGFYFWSYLLATDAWKRWARTPDENEPASSSAAATLMCGGLAGIVTWASVFPLDMIKTRVQAQALMPPKGSTTPHAQPLLGFAGTSTLSPTRLSTLEVTRLAYRDGGLGVFFRGLGVCSVRAFVVNAVQWAVYEWIMREMGASVHR